MESKQVDIKNFYKIINGGKPKTKGDTALLRVNEKDYHGNAQVLAGFFEFHQKGSKAPALSDHPNDELYHHATIDIASIQYIIKSRGWKLPTLSFQQTESLISRL